MTTPNGPSVLDRWEAEAKELLNKKHDACDHPLEVFGDWRDKRILALIELVRKKDEALQDAQCKCTLWATADEIFPADECIRCRALALTDSLEIKE